WEAELDGDHPLACRVLEVLEHALVPGVVRHDQAEPGRSVEDQTEPLDRQLTAVVGQWMKHDGCVLTGLDDLVEVADGTLANGSCQGALDPLGFTPAQQGAPDEIRWRQVIMAGDGDERPVEVVGHRLEEARLPASRRTLEHDRHALSEGRFEDVLFVRDGHVVRPQRARTCGPHSGGPRRRCRRPFGGARLRPEAFGGRAAPRPHSRGFRRTCWVATRCQVRHTAGTVDLHYRRPINRRGTSAERRAERKSGPITWLSCSVLGIVAWAALPNTRRRVLASVLAPMLRQRQPVPRRRASASARRASAAPYAGS